MKSPAFVFKAELGGLLKLGLPIIFTQFIQVSNTTVAILMMGRVGSVELAALGLGGSFMIFVFLICLGIMMSVSPTILPSILGPGAARESGVPFSRACGWLLPPVWPPSFFCVRWDT